MTLAGGVGAAADDLRAKWDARYRESDRIPAPALVLSENLHLLPRSGAALDLACGLGENALLLAEHGLAVSAWDLSPVAIQRLRRAAEVRSLPVSAEVRDVQASPPAPECFDVIVVAHFLDRTLAPAITAALRPGGLLLYQTFTREAVSAQGPSSPAYRLAPNELLRLFPGLLIRSYREEGRCGDLSRGVRDLAMLVGEKPAC
jgi:SAM-dependent methyltransferase